MKQFGKWVTASLGVASPWPSSAQQIEFGEHLVNVRPQTESYYPSISIMVEEGQKYEDYYDLLNHFLSSLTWRSGGIFGVFQMGGGSGYGQALSGFERNSQYFSSYYKSEFPFDKIEKYNKECSLHLSYWREARVLDSFKVYSSYSFLSYYKILELIGMKKVPDELEKFRSEASETGRALYVDALKAMEYFDAINGETLARFLKEGSRHSLAHAYETPRKKYKNYDPDKHSENISLREATKIVKGFSYYMMLKHLGLPDHH